MMQPAGGNAGSPFVLPDKRNGLMKSRFASEGTSQDCSVHAYTESAIQAILLSPSYAEMGVRACQACQYGISTNKGELICVCMCC